MKKAFILAFILFACREGAEKLPHIPCFKMVISDAIPIQFWVDGCETFNQKETAGVYKNCFCQPFECDDVIKIQVTDSVVNDFALTVFDSDENLISLIPFTGSTPVFSVSFVPSDYSICDQQIILKINTYSGLLGIAESTAFNDWSNDISHGDVPWTIDPTNFYVIFGSGPFPGTTSNYAKKSVASGGQYVTVTHTVDISATAGIRHYQVIYEFYFSSSLVGTLSKTYTVPDSESVNFTDSISGPISVFDEIRITIVHPEETFSEWSFESIFLTSVYSIMAQSDCIDIKTSHSETILVNYSNHRNFAGIDNQDVSPDTDFNLRIPASFAEENDLIEDDQEIAELSDNREIQLNSQVKVKRLLDIGHMPMYMHKKLILVLMHQFVNIDGRNWVKGDAYEKVEGNKRYSLKRYRCLLTQQDYIIRNIL